MNRLQAAEQLRRALQMFAATLTEEQALTYIADRTNGLRTDGLRTPVRRQDCRSRSRATK